jgi:hypothetical protein
VRLLQFYYIFILEVVCFGTFGPSPCETTGHLDYIILDVVCFGTFRPLPCETAAVYIIFLLDVVCFRTFETTIGHLNYNYFICTVLLHQLKVSTLIFTLSYQLNMQGGSNS